MMDPAAEYDFLLDRLHDLTREHQHAGNAVRNAIQEFHRGDLEIARATDVLRERFSQETKLAQEIAEIEEHLQELDQIRYLNISTETLMRSVQRVDDRLELLRDDFDQTALRIQAMSEATRSRETGATTADLRYLHQLQVDNLSERQQQLDHREDLQREIRRRESIGEHVRADPMDPSVLTQAMSSDMDSLVHGPAADNSTRVEREPELIRSQDEALMMAALQDPTQEPELRWYQREHSRPLRELGSLDPVQLETVEQQLQLPEWFSRDQDGQAAEDAQEHERTSIRQR